MFRGSNKKTTVKFHYEHEGSGGSSTSVPLKDGELFKDLKYYWDRYGELTIEFVGEDEIRLTTSRTKKIQEVDEKINKIGDLIRTHVKDQMIQMDAHMVLAEGVPKGVFGSIGHANLKKSQLISRGFTEEQVEIEKIKTESFKDLF